VKSIFSKPFDKINFYVFPESLIIDIIQRFFYIVMYKIGIDLSVYYKNSLFSGEERTSVHPRHYFVASGREVKITRFRLRLLGYGFTEQFKIQMLLKKFAAPGPYPARKIMRLFVASFISLKRYMYE
jgi:hypothetical protein